jgi:hypothetical protein
LKTALEGASQSLKKISALDEEIAADPNVVQLREIIAAAQRRETTLQEELRDLPLFVQIVYAALKLVSDALSSTIIIKR